MAVRDVCIHGVGETPLFGYNPWPAAISGNGRHIVTGSGLPWMMRGNTIWSFHIMAGAYDEAASIHQVFVDVCDQYQTKGFNALLLSAFGSQPNGTPLGGDTWDGVAPFTTGTTFNNTYWSRLDDLADVARARGVTLVVDVIDAWCTASGEVLDGISTSDASAIGTQFGNRYKNYPNIIWAVGGDYFGTFDSIMSACLDAIAATGDTHLVTVDYYAESGSYVDSGGDPPSTLGASYADFAYIYTYNCGYLEVQRNYQFTVSPTPATRPAVLMDGIYDQENTAYRKVMQDQLGWAVTSGSPGWLYGAQDPHLWGSGAYAAVFSDTFPNNDLPAMFDYVEALTGWQDLVPDHDESLNFITSSRGTKATAITSGGGHGEYTGSPQNTYVTGAVTADGSLAVVYTPVSGTVTIDETQLVGSYTARWVDPTNAATTSASAGSSYTTPGTNASGNGNWYLVLTG